jgi:SAM-dependent methyltransferase
VAPRQASALTDEEMLSTEEAVLRLRADPRHAQLIHDAYLGEDVYASAERFRGSSEFREALTLLEGVEDADILDVGSGRGVAAYAFASSGARCVYALEPDSSDEIGRGAISSISGGLPIRILDGVGERIVLGDESVDIVYGRQVFHHAADLEAMASECARVVRDGGLLLACREHVVDDDRQLRSFLENHPVHALTGEEHARPLHGYMDAFQAAGFDLTQVLGPWDSVINAFPAVRSTEELSRYPVTLLEERLGALGKIAASIPGVKSVVWARLRRPTPGRLYSFVGKRRSRTSSAEPTS